MKKAVVVALTVIALLVYLRPSRTSRPRAHDEVQPVAHGGQPVAHGTAVHARPLPLSPDRYVVPQPGSAAVQEQSEQQKQLWTELRTFASDVRLTDEQWDHFVRDLTELGDMDRRAWDDALDDGGDWSGTFELTQNLDRELFLRCTTYMTKAQVAELRFRFLSLVTRARQVGPQSQPAQAR